MRRQHLGENAAGGLYNSLLLQQLVLRRGNHEQQTPVIRRRIMMHGPGFGTVIVSYRHLTAGNTASALKDIELFRCGMTVRGIAGAGCKTEECGGPSGSRIKGEQ